MLRTMSAESADGSEVNEELLDSHIKLINKRRLQMEEERRNLSIVNMSRTVELDDGTVLYIKANEYTSHVHAVLPVPMHHYDEFEEEEKKRIKERGIPDYVSGVVTSPVVEKLERTYIDTNGEEVTEEYESLRGVALYDDRFTEEMAKEKLAIAESAAFQGVFDRQDIIYSQHHNINPGMYTGYMRTVVQLLLGVGKVFQDTYERRHFPLLPASNPDEPSNENEPVSPFGLYDEAPTQDRVRVLYDYRFHKTNGISWGSDGTAYVVEISTRGVLMLPLELEPISTTPEGLAQYKLVYPELAEEDERTGEVLLDKLGGFPLGATIPSFTPDFESLLRAGVVVRALDSEAVDPFYSKYFYSSACGWAFRADGRRADNTCYSIDEESEIQLGHHYAVTINIGAPRVVEDDSPELTGEIQAALPAGTPKYLIDKPKNLPENKKRDILRAKDILKALDEAVADPLFQATAALDRIESGILYHPGIHTPDDPSMFSPQPQFKLSEPMLPNAPSISFDFRNVTNRLDYWGQPTCDTPIYVFYKGNSITIIRYFYRPEELKPVEHTSTEAPCQYEGSFNRGHGRPGEVTEGNFYSNDFDPRKNIDLWISDSVITRELVGETYFTQFCSAIGQHSVHTTEGWGVESVFQTNQGGHSTKTALSIPYGSRSLYFVGTFETKTDIQTLTAYGVTDLFGIGPTVLHGHIYNFIAHWWPCPWGPSSEWYDPPPDSSKCTLVEYRDPTTQETCLDKLGPPAFPDYRPCTHTPDRSIRDDWGGVFRYQWRDGEIPTSVPTMDWSPMANLVIYRIHAFGDVPIDGDRLAYEEMADEPHAGTHIISPNDTAKQENPWHPYYHAHPIGMPMFLETRYANRATVRLDFYSTTMSPWWFLPSPTSSGSFAYHRVNQCEFGMNVLVYEPQFDANTRIAGGPDSMHISTHATYIGHVGPHPIPSV